MFRRIASVVLVLAAADLAPAQISEKPIRLLIHPAAPPIPALRYQLLPPLEELSPGNRVLLYYRSFSPEWEEWRRRPGFLDLVDRALHTPLRELPRQELDWILHAKQFHEVDLGARREYVDWGLTPRLRSEGIGMLLPDMQSLRITGNLLALRARLEIADHHYDKALYTLQTGYALARDLGDTPLLISALVGVSIGTVMSRQVEELIQAPGSPNLYWALTALPRPLVSPRKGLQGESMIISAELPKLRDIETTRLSQEQQQMLVDDVLRVMGMIHDERGAKRLSWQARVGLAILVAKAYPEAKRVLVSQGWKAEDVERLPVLQVVMIQTVHEYQRLRDDLFKWVNVPFWQALPELAKVDQQLRTARRRWEAVPLLDFLPALARAYTATSRLDRHLAALRCVEAIRLYAAGHDGQLPAALSAITEVPVPIDPITGKSFEYQVAGNRALLSAAAPPGIPQLTCELILERSQTVP